MNIRFQNKITSLKKSVSNFEKDFDKEAKQIESLQESSNNIIESARKFLKTYSTISKVEGDFLNQLQMSSLPKEDDDFRILQEVWNNGFKLKEEQNKQMELITNKKIIDPVKKLNPIYPYINHCFKKREALYQEYLKNQEKVEKYLKRERTGSNIVKLDQSKKACNTCKAEFEKLNETLSEQVAQFYSLRCPYFQQSIQAFAYSEVNYFDKLHNIQSNIYYDLNKFQELKNEDESKEEEKLSSEINQKLNHIRSMSIAVNDQT